MMSNTKYKNVAFYEAVFYRLDDDGNPLEDENGKTILYTAPKLDFSHMADYVEVKDLVQVREGAWWD
jgi:hypothetical protein|tara:strand:+ start:353 stop:553 length:201 start_codon:yes stop_codon:yes gene_type:complete